MRHVDDLQVCLVVNLPDLWQQWLFTVNVLLNLLVHRANGKRGGELESQGEVPYHILTDILGFMVCNKMGSSRMMGSKLCHIQHI